MRAIGDIFDRFLDIAAYIAMFMISIAMLAVCAEVVFRYFSGESLTWVVDICSIFLLYVTFLGAAWLLRIDGHVNVDIVTSRLKPHVRYILDICVTIFSAIVFSVITWYGARFTIAQFKSGYYMPTPLETPQWIVVIIVPLGSLLLFIQLLRRLRNYQHNKLEILAKGYHGMDINNKPGI